MAKVYAVCQYQGSGYGEPIAAYKSVEALKEDYPKATDLDSDESRVFGGFCYTELEVVE